MQDLGKSIAKMEIRSANGLDAREAEHEMLNALVELFEGIDVEAVQRRDMELDEYVQERIPDLSANLVKAAGQYLALYRDELLAYAQGQSFRCTDPLDFLSFLLCRADRLLAEIVGLPCADDGWVVSDYTAPGFWERQEREIALGVAGDVEKLLQNLRDGDVMQAWLGVQQLECYEIRYMETVSP
jgi:hypothetical protein